MTRYIDNTELETETCYKCSMVFAMPADRLRRLRNNHETFYCPAGHPQHYFGKTEEQKLRDQLASKEEMLTSAHARADRMEAERNQISKAHQKMRLRVINGVCPCCTRSFSNLRQHMKTEHPEFGADRTLHALREAFGMTQADVAREAGVKPVHVSLYERDLPVAGYAQRRLGEWVDNASAKES